MNLNHVQLLSTMLSFYFIEKAKLFYMYCYGTTTTRPRRPTYNLLLQLHGRILQP